MVIGTDCTGVVNTTNIWSWPRRHLNLFMLELALFAKSKIYKIEDNKGSIILASVCCHFYVQVNFPHSNKKKKNENSCVINWFTKLARLSTCRDWLSTQQSHVLISFSCQILWKKKRFYSCLRAPTQGSPDIVKTRRLDFSLSWLKGEVRENLGDFRKPIQILTFLSPLLHVLLPFTKTNNDLKRMQLTSLK